MDRYEIQIADCGEEFNRFNNTLHDKNWNILCYGNTAYDVLCRLLERANNEEFSINTSWLRLVKNDEVETF
jgi:hypothetical protein